MLPTYNERENLPLVLWLVNKHLTARCVVIGWMGGGERFQEGGGKKGRKEGGGCGN